MDNPNLEKRNQQLKKIVSLLIALSACLLVTCFYLYTKLSETKEVVEKEIIIKEVVISEKNDLIEKLSILQEQYDSLGVQHGELKEVFEKERKNIAKLKKELKNYKGNTNAYKKQIELLQQKQNEYIQKIEELIAANEQLTAENVSVKTDLDSAIKANENLLHKAQELTDKIESNAVIKAYEIVAEAIKESKNDTEIEITNKAKRVGKIRTCLVLAENRLIEKGDLSLYFRIMDPNGVVMIDNVEASKVLNIEGKRVLYSLKKDVYYNNSNTKVCAVWENNKRLISGEYIVEIYTENYKLGATSFFLK